MKLTKALDHVEERLTSQEAFRAKAVRRMQARHGDQKALEHKAQRAHNEADRFHRQGKVLRAESASSRAAAFELKAARERGRAIEHKRTAKRKTQQIEKLEVREDELRAMIERWEAAHKPRVNFETRKIVNADDPGEAFIYAARLSVANCSRTFWVDAQGRHHPRPNFYSMFNPGFDPTHEVTRGQLLGERSDCSLYGTGLAYAANLPDPNGLNYVGGGFTGTMLAQHGGWRLCTIGELRAKGWGFVFYGSGSAHHVECYIGEGKSDLTAGHGSPPVDFGVIHLLPGEVERYMIFDPR